MLWNTPLTYKISVQNFVRTFIPCGKFILEYIVVVCSYMIQNACRDLNDHLWQYGMWSFQTGGTKLEKNLPKNQHTQRKLLNFENWINWGLRSFQKSEFEKSIIFIFSRKKIPQIEIMA